MAHFLHVFTVYKQNGELKARVATCTFVQAKDILRNIQAYRSLMKSYKFLSETRQYTKKMGSLKVVQVNQFQTHSENGRVMADAPNIQQTPKETRLRMISTRQSVAPRTCFIARPGKRLIAVDYRQIELRMLVHFCGDGELLKIFDADSDPFRIIASKWLECNEGKFLYLFPLSTIH